MFQLISQLLYEFILNYYSYSIPPKSISRLVYLASLQNRLIAMAAFCCTRSHALISDSTVSQLPPFKQFIGCSMQFDGFSLRNSRSSWRPLKSTISLRQLSSNAIFASIVVILVFRFVIIDVFICEIFFLFSYLVFNKY